MKKTCIAIIHFYKKHLSNPNTAKCKFVPTCSNYALEAIEKYGVAKGCMLTIWRLFRCNPFSKGGYDPVP